LYDEDQPTEQEERVQEARALYSADREVWSGIYNKACDDLHFLSDEKDAQWDSEAAERRRRAKKPVITIDQTSQFVHQVVNDIRQNTPTINVIPHSGGAREEVAKMIKGLFKNIEYRSNADAVYDNAAEFSVKCGLGWIRVDHDYETDVGFEQELLLRPVINPMSVVLDSNSILPDGSDAKHAYVLEEISVKDFKRRFKGFEVCSFTASEEDLKQEVKSDYVTIAEYFAIQEEEKEIGLREEVDLETGQIAEIVEEVQDGVEYIQQRKVQRKKVKRCLMSGKDILEETDFPGKYIPIVPVYGEIHWTKGKRHIFSLIRKSHDSQKMFNFWKSLEVELLMKSPKAKFMAAVGQTEDFADDWKNADKAEVLRYKPTDVNGQPTSPPISIPPPPIPTGVVNASRGAVDDIKATMGMYGASLGQRSNETSGVAIAARKAEGDNATYHFADNLSRSIQHVGRVLLSAMKEIYDTPRILRILGEEDDVQEIGVNGQMSEGQEEQYDLTQGEYDVRVITGASYATKRQEAAEFFSQIVSNNPAMMQTAGDLVFKYMDVPGADALASRMKKLLPPELQDDEDGEEQDPRLMQAEQIIQQSQQAIEELTARLQQAEAQLEDKNAEMQLKAQSEESKAQNDRAKLEIEIMKLRLEEEKIRLEAAIKERELDLKEGELGIKAADTQAKGIAAMQSSGNEADVITGEY
jgi:hypothetical protein